MGRITKVIAGIGLLFFMISKSFIYEMVVLRKWDRQYARYNYFIGLSDFHDRTNKINDVQLSDLSEILKKCYPGSLYVGAEDISSPAKSGSTSCGRFFVHARGGVLAGFSKLCKDLKMNLENFEYRYCRVASLGPVLNNLNSDPNIFPSVKETMVYSIVKEIENVFNEILSYDDEVLLRDLYRHAMLNIKKQMNEFKLYEYKDKTIVQYLDIMTNKKNRLAFLKKILTFDSILFDLRMLHSVVKSNKRGSYLAVAGGSHISRIAKLISKLGWEWVHATRPSFKREYESSKCLGSNIIEGKYCRRPKSINIKMIEDFL
ncbi:hypothetical protein KAH94_01525 [bacterium]|nr:hypothetical protein [bacterium]